MHTLEKADNDPNSTKAKIDKVRREVGRGVLGNALAGTASQGGPEPELPNRWLVGGRDVVRVSVAATTVEPRHGTGTSI